MSKTYEVMVYRDAQWKSIEVEADRVYVNAGTASFWRDDALVAAFPPDGWHSVTEKVSEAK